jgi:hypothetical protein
LAAGTSFIIESLVYAIAGSIAIVSAMAVHQRFMRKAAA